MEIESGRALTEGIMWAAVALAVVAFAWLVWVEIPGFTPRVPALCRRLCGCASSWARNEVSETRRDFRTVAATVRPTGGWPIADKLHEWGLSRVALVLGLVAAFGLVAWLLLSGPGRMPIPSMQDCVAARSVAKRHGYMKVPDACYRYWLNDSVD